jgi:hypothetical protein
VSSDDVAVESREHDGVMEISDRDAFEAAVLDPVAGDFRVRVCDVLTEAVRTAGQAMWVGGWLLRDDWSRGLGIAVQMGGELASGAVTLLRAARHYPAAALIRQLVEVEYLVFVFNEDDVVARDWLTSTPEQLRAVFRPAAMRRRSGGRFRDSEYWAHCEVGGHPHPHGARLLPDHSAALADNAWLWGDLAQHRHRLWRSLREAAESHEFTDVLRAVDDVAGSALLADWLAHDALADGVTLWD